MPTTTYGDISPSTAGYVVGDLLKRGMPYLVLERFGQAKTLPKNNTQTMIFKRYNALDPSPNALQEGITPTAKKLSMVEIPVTLTQYGDLVEITDIVEDTHEDPVMKEATDILGEQAAVMIETVRYNVLKAGTNVVYASGEARNEVNSPLTLSVQRKATRALKGQDARPITRIVRSTPDYGTQSVAPGYIGLVHPYLGDSVRAMPGFVSAENYGQMTPYESEIGKVEDVRYVSSTVFSPWEDAGGEKGTMLSTSGVKADVYPVLYIARDAYGIVALKGQNSITPAVVNPKPSAGDRLGQKGSVGWKAMQGAIILNDLWMIRAEVAVED